MRCPYCMTEIDPAAVRCAACTSWLGVRPVREWTRARSGRMIGGVARGLANRFGLPIAAVRLVFLLSVLLGGWGILVYLALWIAMPEEPLGTLTVRPGISPPPSPPSVEPPAPTSPPAAGAQASVQAGEAR